MMRIIRFKGTESHPVLAVITDDNEVYQLPFEGFLDIVNQAEAQGITPLDVVNSLITNKQPLTVRYQDLDLLTPITPPEVWAAGVTYERSREARNEEINQEKVDIQTFYDKVYDSDRPEVFFKSNAARTVGPNQSVCLRSDSNWQVPEPEVGLVLDRKGTILGYTLGNDMSCRDIEGENPLYLPQAKIWKNSCAIGPAICLAETLDNPYQLEIHCRIYRNGKKIFEGTDSTSNLKRTYIELVDYLLKNNVVLDGTILLTGTPIVPPYDFTLKDRDQIEIEVKEIGILRNTVEQLVEEKLLEKGV